MCGDSRREDGKQQQQETGDEIMAAGTDTEGTDKHLIVLMTQRMKSW